ncbi:hypothetical protein C0J52_13970 [Blattella germanica]|nr:hypothetical protein C0J52_13970 [Blattella germanica]
MKGSENDLRSEWLQSENVINSKSNYQKKYILLCLLGRVVDDLDYSIVLAKDVDAKQILSMLRRTFFLDEPLIQALGLSVGGKEKYSHSII